MQHVLACSLFIVVEEARQQAFQHRLISDHFLIFRRTRRMLSVVMFVSTWRTGYLCCFRLEGRSKTTIVRTSGIGIEQTGDLDARLRSPEDWMLFFV